MTKAIPYILVLMVLMGLASRTEADVCKTMGDFIDQHRPVVATLRQQITLQQLDLNSYNTDQHDTPEYIDRKIAYDSMVENFNAQVANLNRQIDMYKRVCEREAK